MGDLATFIDSLRLLRLGRRIKQQDLARRIGVAQNVLSYYESHRSEPATETLVEWAAALDVEIPDGVSGRVAPVARCGTESGYTAHRRRGESACAECRTARARYMKDWRKRGTS